MMETKFRVFLDGKMYYPGSENHPDVWFYVSQNCRVVTLPKMMGKRFDPVLYQDAVATFWTGQTDHVCGDIYDGDILEFDCEDRGGGTPEAKRHVVKWDDEKAGWDLGSVDGVCAKMRCVVGNIHEDSDLIE